MSEAGTSSPGPPGPTSPHPLRIAAVEACARIGEPLSPLLLHEILDREADFPTVAYHVVRLVDAGVLAEHSGAAPEGPTEHFYRLVA